jgi:hypothetical protein
MKPRSWTVLPSDRATARHRDARHGLDAGSDLAHALGNPGRLHGTSSGNGATGLVSTCGNLSSISGERWEGGETSAVGGGLSVECTVTNLRSSGPGRIRL